MTRTMRHGYPMHSSHRRTRLVWGIIPLLVLLLGCSSSRELTPPTPTGPPPEKLNELAYHYFTNGTILMLDRQYRNAVVEFEKALALEPNSREIRLSLAECYHSLGEDEKAVAALTPIEPKDAAVWQRLAQHYRGQGRGEEAWQAYQQVLTLEPDNVDALWYSVRYALAQKRHEEAVRLMEQLTEFQRTPRMMTELARVYQRVGKIDQAIRLLQEVIDGVYGVPVRDAFDLLTDLYDAHGRVEDQIATLRRAMNHFPNRPNYSNRLINILIGERRYEEAAAELTQYLEIYPDFSAQLRLGVLSFELQRYAVAESLFTLAHRVQPDDYIVLLYLGRLQMVGQQFDSARTFFARAVEIDDERPEAYESWISSYLAQDSLRRAIAIAMDGVDLAREKIASQFLAGIAYTRLEQLDSAVIWLERAHARDQGDLRIHFALASAYERAGSFKESEEALQRIIAVDSSYAAALNYLGYMYADEGMKLDTALLLIERAVELEPDNGAYLDSYAWVLYKLDRVEDAAVQIRKAVSELQFDDPVVFDHYGDILHRLGEIESARDQWSRALELDPGNESIQEKLRTIEP